MTAYADAAPWNGHKAISWDEKTAKGNYRGTLTKGNLAWDIGGFHNKREKGWTKGASRTSRIVYDLQGNRKKITYYNTDYDDYIGFTSGASDMEQRLADADAAFDESRGDSGRVYSSDGIGHIARIEYAEKDQILRVTFANGSICVFFRVPTSVAGTLLHHAQTKRVSHTDSQGIERHSLGTEFWNLVRIRGQKVGSRYPFEYVNHESSLFIDHANGTASYKIKVKNLRDYFGEKYVPINMRQKGYDEQYVTVPLTEHEVITALAELKNLSSGAEIVGWEDPNDGTNHDARYWTNERDETHTVPHYGHGAFTWQDAETGQPTSSAKLADLANTVMSISQDKIDAFFNDPTVTAYSTSINNVGGVDEMSATQERMKLLEALGPKISEGDDYDLDKLVNSRTGRRRNADTYRKLAEMLRANNLKGEIKSWTNENVPELRKLAMGGKLWTPEMLKEMANPTMPGGVGAGHYTAYKSFIDAQDWKGALDFLKTHNTDMMYYDKNGRQHLRRHTRYAGGYDKLTLDDDEE